MLAITAVAGAFFASQLAWGVLHDEHSTAAIGVIGPPFVNGIDIWEPLLAIATHAGGDWPERASAAAIALSAPIESDEGSDGVRLLVDIRRAFDLVRHERVSSADLVRVLTELEDRSFGDIQQLDARELAGMLKPFDVRPRLVRVNEAVLRGYFRTDFADPFDRYLPPSVPASTGS